MISNSTAATPPDLTALRQRVQDSTSVLDMQSLNALQQDIATAHDATNEGFAARDASGEFGDVSGSPLLMGAAMGSFALGGGALAVASFKGGRMLTAAGAAAMIAGIVMAGAQVVQYSLHDDGPRQAAISVAFPSWLREASWKLPISISHDDAAAELMSYLDHDGSGSIELATGVPTAQDEQLVRVESNVWGQAQTVHGNLRDDNPAANKPAYDYSPLLTRADADGDHVVTRGELANIIASTYETDGIAGLTPEEWDINAGEGHSPDTRTLLTDARDAQHR